MESGQHIERRKDNMKAPEKKTRRRPKVYVVQSQLNRDGAPKYDMTPAEDYGDLVVLLDETASPFRPKPLMEVLQERLQEFREGDYLLPVGNPVFIGLATLFAADASPVVKYLLWSGKEQRYVAVEVDVDMHGTCI